MVWRCQKCGEQHTDAFDTCWRCSPPPDESEPDLAAYLEGDDEDQLPQLTPEQQAIERAALDKRAAAIIEEQGGLYAGREARAAAGVARMQEAYALYRLRQEPTRFLRPTGEALKLNHLWSVVMWSAGVATGLMLVVVFQSERVFLFFGEWPLYGLLGSMVFSVLFADYVADREIKFSEGPESRFRHKDMESADAP
jgi:hypothetical protein